MAEPLEVDYKDVRDGPHSQFLDYLPLLVALRAEEGVIFAESLLAGVQAETNQYVTTYCINC